MSNVTNLETERLIRSRVAEITDLQPEILFRNGTTDILFSFWKKIPDEKQTMEIEKVLQEFGKPISNSCREAQFVSYLILRSCS